MLLALMLAVVLRPWAPYREVCERLHLTRYISMPEADHSRVLPILRLSAESGPPQVVTLVIRAKAGDIPLEPAQDGTVAFPLRKSLLDENPPVLTSLPAEVKTKVALNLRPLLPEGLNFAYADLFRAVIQANRLIREEAGFFKFLAPKMKGLVLRFGSTQSALVGDTVLNSRDDGTLKLPLDDDLLAANPRVTLSARPDGADFLE